MNKIFGKIVSLIVLSLFVLFLIPSHFSFAIPPPCQTVADSKPYLGAVLADVSFGALKNFDIESYEAMDCSLGGLMTDQLSIVYVTPKNLSSLGIQYKVQINLKISRDKKLVTITDWSVDKHPDSIRATIESIEKYYRSNLVIAEFINRFGVKNASIHSDNDVALNGKDTAWLTFAYDTGVVYNTYPEIKIKDTEVKKDPANKETEMVFPLDSETSTATTAHQIEQKIVDIENDGILDRIIKFFRRIINWLF